MGIECHLNFDKPDQILTRRVIKQNQQNAFFGSAEYKRRIKQSEDLTDMSLKQISPTNDFYDAYIKES